MEQVLFVTNDAKAKAACAEAASLLQMHGVKAEVKDTLPQEVASGAARQGMLVLADSEQVLHTLKEAGCPAVAYRHPGNADVSFSGTDFIFEEPEQIDFDSYVKAHQRLTGVPWDILETNRLRVRETTVEDVDRFYALYADPEMTRYMEGLFPDPADEKRYMADYIRNVYALTGFGVWTVMEKESGDIIGRAGYSIRNGFDHIELGFLIGVAYQHRGYATEVLTAILAYGRDMLGLDAVQALVKEDNTVSVHLLERLGFTVQRKVTIEEDIYGGSYAGADERGYVRVALSPARYGTYLELLKKWRE